MWLIFFEARRLVVSGEERRGETADDQGSERGAASGGSSPGAAQEAQTESDAEGERGAKGQCCGTPRSSTKTTLRE